MEQQPKHSRKDYLTLFTSTFTLSAFTFGGGFVIIPLMRKKFVEQLHWIDEEEMMDLTAIAQSSPGAIAVNASILVGYRVAGVPGALVTVLGNTCAAGGALSSFYPSFLFFTLRFGITASSRWSCGGCRPAWPPSSATWC